MFGINTTFVSNLTRPTARDITYNNFEISLVVFMPNITTNHAFTHTNSLIISGLAHTQKAPVELFNQGTQNHNIF